MLKQVFLARFEPVLTEFSPFHHMYAPRCALHTYLTAVSRSRLELGEGCRLEEIYIYIYINSVKTGSKWARSTCFSIANGLSSLFEKHIFNPFLVPNQPIFKAFQDFSWAKTRHYGLKLG